MTAGIQQCRCTTQGAITTWQNLQLVCITSQEEEWFLLLPWLENLKLRVSRWRGGIMAAPVSHLMLYVLHKSGLP